MLRRHRTTNFNQVAIAIRANNQPAVFDLARLNWISVSVKHVFGRNPMFSGTRKDYCFHYSAGDLAHDFVSEMSSAMQADVCRRYLMRQTCFMPQA